MLMIQPRPLETEPIHTLAATLDQPPQPPRIIILANKSLKQAHGKP